MDQSCIPFLSSQDGGVAVFFVPGAEDRADIVSAARPSAFSLVEPSNSLVVYTTGSFWPVEDSSGNVDDVDKTDLSALQVRSGLLRVLS